MTMTSPSVPPDLSKLRINRDSPPPGLRRAFRRNLALGFAALAIGIAVLIVLGRGRAVPVQVAVAEATTAGGTAAGGSASVTANGYVVARTRASVSAKLAGRIGLIILPPIVYVFTYRICLGLQKHDREVLEHGLETGVIRRLPHGEFIEVHQPLGPVDEHGHGQLAYGGAPVPKKMNQVGGARRAIRGFFKPIEEPIQVELEPRQDEHGLAAAEADRELTTSGRPSDGGRPQEPRD